MSLTAPTSRVEKLLGSLIAAKKIAISEAFGSTTIHRKEGAQNVTIFVGSTAQGGGMFTFFTRKERAFLTLLFGKYSTTKPIFVQDKELEAKVVSALGLK